MFAIHSTLKIYEDSMTQTKLSNFSSVGSGHPKKYPFENHVTRIRVRKPSGEDNSIKHND